MHKSYILFLLSSVAHSVIVSAAFSQTTIITDGSLGPATDLGRGNVVIPSDIGQTEGQNLFHSFETFDIGRGDRATFTGPDNLANVISRVTGGQESNINGTLASRVGNADVWLVNPAGVTFGRNARLDVPAGFHVSSADSVEFADGSQFSASDLAGSTLTIATPESFGFLGSSNGKISTAGTTLEVGERQQLSLVGSEISITDSELVAPAGQVLISTEEDPNRIGTIPLSNLTGRIEIADSNVYSTGNGGGRIDITGGTIDVSGYYTSVYSDNDGSASSAGGLFISGREINVDQANLGAISIDAGDGGDIRIDGEAISFTNYAQVVSDTIGQGNAGSLTINAGALIVEDSSIYGDSGAYRTGGAGSITVTAESLLTVDGGLIQGGEIKITAEALLLQRFGAIESSSAADRGGGSVEIKAGVLTADGGGIRSDTSREDIADGGAITIMADELLVSNGGFIESNTFGIGDGGSVTIDAGDLRVIDRFSSINSYVNITGSGDAGSITITAEKMRLNNGAGIDSSTDGEGNAGSVTIDAGELTMVGAGIYTIAGSTSQGEAGNITVNIDALQVYDQSRITSSAYGRLDYGRNAGRVDIMANRISLKNASEISSSSSLGSIAGDVTLFARQLVQLSGSTIATSGAESVGGRIDITAGQAIRLDQSEITTSGALPAEGASLLTLSAPLVEILGASRVLSLAGDDVIGPEVMVRTGEAQVEAAITVVSDDSEIAASTSLEIQGLDSEVGSSLQISNAVPVNVRGLLSAPCAVAGGNATSSFANRVRLGLKESPVSTLGAGPMEVAQKTDC